MDVKKELIELDRTEVDVSADSLPQFVPEDSPRYHFYRFKHTHEGDYQEVIGEPLVDLILMAYFIKLFHISAVFIYSCPGFKSSIKERMLYSSCKEPLIAGVEQDLGIKVTKKVCTLHVCSLVPRPLPAFQCYSVQH